MIPDEVENLLRPGELRLRAAHPTGECALRGGGDAQTDALQRSEDGHQACQASTAGAADPQEIDVPPQ